MGWSEKGKKKNGKSLDHQNQTSASQLIWVSNKSIQSMIDEEQKKSSELTL
jgi:hypothetical protein